MNETDSDASRNGLRAWRRGVKHGKRAATANDGPAGVTDCLERRGGQRKGGWPARTAPAWPSTTRRDACVIETKQRLCVNGSLEAVKRVGRYTL
jgi:hypothetical protein